MTESTAYPFQQLTSSASEYQALQFMLWQRLLRVQTAIPVQIVAVHGGGVGMTGTVDVLPLVNQVDGSGNSVPHTTIFGRPYLRIQGGTNAVICDPVAGDIGLCVFASRDISAVIKAAQSGASNLQVNPGSARIHDYADGLYIGGFLNGTPQNYVQFASGNIVNVTAGTVNITSTIGQTTIDGRVFLAHHHVPGTYVAGGTAVTGDSGNVV